MEVSSPTLRGGVFTTLNLSSRRTTRGFNFLISTCHCNTPPRNNVNVNLSHLMVLVYNYSSLHSIVTFPGISGANRLVSNTPSEISRGRLSSLSVTMVRRGGWGVGDWGTVVRCSLTGQLRCSVFVRGITLW